MSKGLIKIRRGIASLWASANPTLLAGEFGLDTTNARVKIGDGATAWSSLSYLSTRVLSGSGAPGGGTGVDGDYYIATSTTTLYGPKASGSWPGGTVLIGTNGWSPTLQVVADGARYVLQIIGWVGGAGTPPSSTNQFIGSSGIVSTAALAQDIRGATGSTGAGVPNGGSTGQGLFKNSATNQDTSFANTPTDGTTITVTGNNVIGVPNGGITQAKQSTATANSVAGEFTGSAAAPQYLALTANTFPARASTGNVAAKTLTDAGLTWIAYANSAAQTAALDLATGSLKGLLAPADFTKLGSQSGTNTGDVTLAAVAAVPNANGASLSGQVLNLQPASASFPGVITAAQFVVLNNTSGTNTGNVSLAAVGASPNANGATLTGQALNLELASASFPGLATAAQFTKLANTTNTNSGDITLGPSGASPNAQAASLSGQVLTLQSASQAFAGNMSAADKLRLDSQPRNLMSDVPGGTNVKSDGLYLLDATMTSGTQIINSASATFTTADQGKICGMNGVGPGGMTLYGTITTRNSATQIVVSFQASTTVAASGVFLYGTDDLTAFNAATADGGRWRWPDSQEVNNRATRMLLSNAPNAITQPNTQIVGSGGITSYDVGFNERGNFVHIMRSNNPNTGSLTLGVTQLTGPAIKFSAVIGSGNQAQKGIRLEGFTVECAGNVPIGVQGISSHKGYMGDIHIKNPAYRAYDFTTVGGQLGEATDYSRNLHERLSCRNLDGGSSSTTASGAVANLFANANLVLASAAAFSTSGGLGIAMTTIGGQVRPTLFQYLAVSGATLTGITCLYTVSGQSAALASGAVVVPAGPYYADGFVLDGDPNAQNVGAGNAPGNTSLNHFYDCSVVHAGGMARRYLNADSNKAIGFLVNRASGGTGVGVGYWGAASATNTARNNLDVGGDPGTGGAVIYGQEMTGITANPLANRWYDYELGNGAPRPVNGTGGTITTSDYMVIYNGALVPGFHNRVQSATGNAATVGGAGTATTGILPGMFVIFPPQGPAVGTTVKFRVILTKTLAGTSITFGLKYGVLNTASDTAVSAQPVAWTGTAVVETITLDVTATFTVIGASASITAVSTPYGRSLGSAAITGWCVAASYIGQVWTPTTFNSAVANPGPAYLGLYVTATTGTITTVQPGSMVEVIAP